jgi:hypothetical protein
MPKQQVIATLRRTRRCMPLVAASLLGCAPAQQPVAAPVAPPQASPPATPPSKDDSHPLVGEELAASQAATRTNHSQCARGEPYRPPAKDLVPIDVSLSVHLSKYFRQPATLLCMLLDGAPVLARAELVEVGQRLANGALATRSIPVSRTEPHELVLLIKFDGTGPGEGYQFEMRSVHRFAASADRGGEVLADVHERPVVPLEQRLTVAWDDQGGVTQVK